MIQQALDVFWSEWFWLPHNLTWANFTNGPDKEFVYPEMGDILYQIPMTILILVLRVLLTKNIFVPLGKILGVPEKKKRNNHSQPLLEAAYKSSCKNVDLSFLAKKLDMTERQIERWFRLRRNQDKSSKMDKFCETTWKCSFLIVSAAFGFYSIHDKDWFWNIELVLVRLTTKSITSEIWWYYLVNISFYWSLIVVHFNDVRRNDFWQMFMHHIIAIILLIISWRMNIYEYGMAILPLHDSSELLLQFTKAMRYANFSLVSTSIAFAIFTMWWVICRLYIYPVYIFWPIYSSINKVSGMIPIAAVGVCGLSLLLVLQIWWTWLIVLFIYKALVKKSYRDVRSSESEISDSEEENFEEK